MQDAAEALVKDLEVRGPELKEWRNFGLLEGKKKGRKVYHAHLNSQKPRYVVVWELIGDDVIELLFFGTHEKVDYKRL